MDWFTPLIKFGGKILTAWAKLGEKVHAILFEPIVEVITEHVPLSDVLETIFTELFRWFNAEEITLLELLFTTGVPVLIIVVTISGLKAFFSPIE